MKKLIQRWLATTKHIIIADSESGFRDLFAHTLAEFETLGMRVVRIKIRKKKQNSDYRGYTRNYRAVIWTKTGETK